MGIRQKIDNKFRIWKNYLHRVLSLRNKNFSSSDRTRNQAVYFDLPYDAFNRHFYPFVFHFLESNYDVYIRSRPVFLGSLGITEYFTEWLLETPHVWFTPRDPEFAKIRFCLEGHEQQHPGFIAMSKDYFSSKFSDPTGFYVPMSLHPSMYREGFFLQAKSLRHRSNRKIRIFFAGNIDEQLYASSSPFFSNQENPVVSIFKKTSRHQAINWILQHLPPNLLLTPSSITELNGEAASGKVVLINTGILSVPMNHLLETLSNNSFFLALPGMYYPLCHNVIEAMCVGCIPILEYPEYFPKPLENGKNCIAFKGIDDLLITIKAVLEMSEEEISTMRQNVCDYYDEYLASQAIVNQLEKSLKQVKKLYLNAGWQSVSMLLDAKLENDYKSKRTD